MVVSSFGIEKGGKPYYLVDLPTIRYNTVENVKDASGKVLGSRNVTKELKQEPLKKTPEECGWQKTVTFEDIVLLDIANPRKHGKLEKALFHRVYEVTASEYYKRHKCNICEHNGLGSKLHYFRCMPAGIYHICWLMACKYGRSASGPIRTIANREGTVSPWVKLKKERKISKREANQILKRLQRAANMDVALYLKGFEVV